MTHLRYFDSAVRKDANQRPVAESSSAVPPGVDPGIYCAYNQNRERFLSAEVDAADFTALSLDTRLPALGPNSSAGLWLIPFRGISATSVRVPIDLVYLDSECLVIEAVESFPISRVSASSRPCTSVLVLPVGAIRSTETKTGDQLILCSPEEMKRHLQLMAGASRDAQAEARQEPALTPAKESAARNSAGRVLQWDDRFKPRSAMDQVAAEELVPNEVPEESPAVPAVVLVRPEEQDAVASQPATSLPKPPPELPKTDATEPAQKSAKPAKSWLKRLLSPDPPLPRKAPRESLPGLAAYFFTGGAPVAHGVRDVSLTGMYIFTEERWYPGTVVRMTLTDSLQPTAERSITLNVVVIRWGNDGVGLKFVLQHPKDRRPRQVDDMSSGADIMEIDRFLEQLRGARSQDS